MLEIAICHVTSYSVYQKWWLALLGQKVSLWRLLTHLEVDVKVDKTPERRNLTPEKGDFQPSFGDKVEQQTKKSRRAFLDDMDSIAYGVEAWFEENTGHSRRVTEETVDIARKLGVPESEIRRWAACRLNRSTEKSRVINSLLERLQASSPADRV